MGTVTDRMRSLFEIDSTTGAVAATAVTLLLWAREPQLPVPAPEPVAFEESGTSSTMNVESSIDEPLDDSIAEEIAKVYSTLWSAQGDLDPDVRDLIARNETSLYL